MGVKTDLTENNGDTEVHMGEDILNTRFVQNSLGLLRTKILGSE